MHYLTNNFKHSQNIITNIVICVKGRFLAKTNSRLCPDSKIRSNIQFGNNFSETIFFKQFIIAFYIQKTI